MAMNDNGTKALGILLLVSALVQPAAASTGATGTPVPFPKAPRLSTVEQLDSDLAVREQLLAAVSQYIRDLHTATESYRDYVEVVQRLVADCEIESDTAGFEGTGWEGLVASGGTQCKEWVAAFDIRAQKTAKYLDGALEYQRLMERVGERVQRQIDRIYISRHAQQLKNEVDQSVETVRQSHEVLEQMKRQPW